MRLKEYKDAHGNKVNTSSSTGSSSASSGSFKKRLDKLIKYYGQHLPKTVASVNVTLLTNDTLAFTEYYDDGTVTEFNIYIGPTTEAWRLKIMVDSKLTDDLAGQGWVELLKTLRAFITVPVVSTPEYKDLLVEWVDKNGNKVSQHSSGSSQPAAKSFGGYKKKFEKLIKYHIDHASPELESVTKKDIKDYSFHLGEHYNDTKYEIDRDIVVAYDKKSDSFFLHIFINGSELQSIQAESYEDLVKYLWPYMFLPDSGTTEYDDLLVESVSSIAEEFKAYENLWD